MIKGKRGKYLRTTAPYKAGEWVMVHTGSDQRVAQVQNASTLFCNLRFWKNETWTEIESGLDRVEITHNDIPVPITSIAYAIPEDVAKNLLLLQGVEL